jgi:hypothetical protein
MSILRRHRTTQLAYYVFVSDPPATRADGRRLPNGEPKRGSPVASTLIYGRKHAVLVDPGFLAEQADAIGDCIARRGCVFARRRR